MIGDQILVVEDNDEIREFLVPFLTHEFPQYSVRGASDGQAALEILEELDRPPCLILLDLVMPRINGWAFIDIVRGTSHLSAVPIAVMSAVEGPVAGTQHCLSKPFTLEALRALVSVYCVPRAAPRQI